MLPPGMRPFRSGRCICAARRGRDSQQAAQALRDYAQLLTLPFGQYTPEMVHWLRDQAGDPRLE